MMAATASLPPASARWRTTCSWSLTLTLNLAAVVALLPAASWAATAESPSATAAMTPAQATSLSAAIADRKAGRYAEAFAALRLLTTSASALGRPWHELGVLYTLHGQFDDARRAFETAIEREPGLDAARHSLAEVLRADGRFSAALPHYRALVDGRAGGLSSLQGLASCLLAVGDKAEAQTALASLQLADPGGEAGAWAAERLAALQREAAAASAAPADLADVEAQGTRHFDAGRFREAADLFGVACREAPSAERCYRQAVALLACRRYLDAVGALRAALAVDRGHLPSLSAWPTALRKVRQEGSGGLNVEFADADAGWPPARAVAALLSGDRLLAERVANTALLAAPAGAPASILLLLVRGEARLRRGDPGRSRADFELILRRVPTHSLARAGVVACGLAEGRDAWARSTLGLVAPPSPPEGVEVPMDYDPDADLHAWSRWRSDEVEHRLRMFLDPGIKPRPAFTAPVLIDVDAMRPAMAVESADTAKTPPRRRRR